MLLSVVVPVFNEEESLPNLYDRTAAVLNELQSDWELILVDDGSVRGRSYASCMVGIRVSKRSFFQETLDMKWPRQPGWTSRGAMQ